MNNPLPGAESPTPRTDGQPFFGDHVSIHFARTLERELDWATKEYGNALAGLRRELTEARAQVEKYRLQCALAGVGDFKGDYYMGHLTTTGNLRAQLAALEADKVAVVEAFISAVKPASKADASWSDQDDSDELLKLSDYAHLLERAAVTPNTKKE